MKLHYLFVFMLAVAFSLTSCNKCDPTSMDDGIIIKDVIVRVIGHPPGPSPQLVRQQGTFGLEYEYSTDGGYFYDPVDFSQFSMMCLPVTARCSSGFLRTVTLDSEEKTAEYNIVVSECESCETRNETYNWVLVEKVPDDYTPVFTLN